MLLLPRGAGVRHLGAATLNPKDASEVAKQIAFVLNVPLREQLEEAVRDWILAARKQGDLLHRATGINGNDLEWRSLGPPERASSGTAKESGEPGRETELQEGHGYGVCG